VKVSGQLHDSAALSPGKEPLDRRLGRTQSRSARSGEEKNSQPQPAFELPNIQPVAQRYTTDLPIMRLFYTFCAKAYNKLFTVIIRK
jgi:hypothetical protein